MNTIICDQYSIWLCIQFNWRCCVTCHLVLLMNLRWNRFLFWWLVLPPCWWNSLGTSHCCSPSAFEPLRKIGYFFVTSPIVPNHYPRHKYDCKSLKFKLQHCVDYFHFMIFIHFITNFLFGGNGCLTDTRNRSNVFVTAWPTVKERNTTVMLWWFSKWQHFSKKSGKA